LEQSNVDIAQEFINMIAAQRGFEADSKTLTTADQLLSDLMMVRR
jgi:flagellar hook protein FlgE